MMYRVAQDFFCEEIHRTVEAGERIRLRPEVAEKYRKYLARPTADTQARVRRTS